MKEDEEIPDCKITLIGDSGVGKTSIIGRFITGIFKSEMNITVGGVYSKKYYKKKGKKICLNLWDTAGQKKYRSLGKNFYKNSFIILIVYDICSRKSFESIKNIWYPDIKNNGEKFNIIAIVGNKKDKYEEEEVTEQEAMNFAEEIDGKFFLVSAYNGEGIDTMFQTLANNFFDEVFMSKVNESRELRKDSIVLNDKILEKKYNNNNCC